MAEVPVFREQDDYLKLEAERDLAEQKAEKLIQALHDYADHQSWRCSYRSRYKVCCCGLDDLMKELGLPPMPVHDPEAEK